MRICQQCKEEKDERFFYSSNINYYNGKVCKTCYCEYLRSRNNTEDYRPKGIFSHLKKSAREREITFNMLIDDFICWYENKEKVCEYCGRNLEQVNNSPMQYFLGAGNAGIKRMTIDRVDSNKGYQLDNIVLACFMCNSIKNDCFTYEEMKIVANVLRRKENIIKKSIQSMN